MALERTRLTRDMHLWQRRGGHRVATDDVLCAWAGLASRPDARRILDLGCGQGAVTLMLAGALPEAELVGVEALPLAAELAERNVASNRLAQRVTIVTGDLRDEALSVPGGPAGFDLVTGSPPFLPLGSGTMPSDPHRAAGRFELRGGVEDYARAARRYLVAGGRVSLLMDAVQDDRCRAALAAADLCHLATRVIVPRAGKVPRYRIYQATPGADPRAPEPAIDRLVIRDASGAWTPDFERARALLGLPGCHEPC